MSESASCHFHLEWPAAGACIRGPVVWLRGWAVGHPGRELTDLRARCGDLTHLGILGFPRTDVAAHLGAPHAWLPAEFVVGVPLPDGPSTILLEARDCSGSWQTLCVVPLAIDPTGEPSPRHEGRLVTRPEGTWTVRGTHLPFHGHLDDPGEEPISRHGRIPIFGWLHHESQEIETVLATSDTLVFNHLEHGLMDEALVAKLSHQAARNARLIGEVDAPGSLDIPACLRVYARLHDGSIHLCFAQRFHPLMPAEAPPEKPASLITPEDSILPTLPSGRPRRLLVFLRTLQPCDATERALDIARHLLSSVGWAIRAVSIDDGPLRSEFEASGVAVQFVDPQGFYDAPDRNSAERELGRLGENIWWGHLDAVAVFEPLCYWSIALARRAGLPVLFDCSIDTPLQPQSGASAAIVALTWESWRGATTVCYGCCAFAAMQSTLLGGIPSSIIPIWHSPQAKNSGISLPGRRLAVAPIRPLAADGAAVLLRAADWLSRRHAAVAANWRIAVTRALGTKEEQPIIRDYLLNQPVLMALEPIPLGAASACLNTAYSGAPLRAMLDAAAMGIPLITTSTAAVRAFFPPAEACYLSPNNPLAVAHALLDLEANPTAAARRAEALRRRILTDHAPVPLLARWKELLDRTATTRK